MDPVLPRQTPDRDTKYMGLAWFHAGFSKDPTTQVGAVIIGPDNRPLGTGYNGPPGTMDDAEVVWNRPDPDRPEEICKYDLMIHAEINAVDHSGDEDLSKATLYVTALPCPACMLSLCKKREKKIGRIVYFDFQSDSGSILQNSKWMNKSLEIARRSNIKVEKFEGDLSWVPEWTDHLKRLGIFKSGS